MTSAPPLDWGIGNYERTAAQLEPAARLIVDRAAPSPGERVVDVGCGTGNAALLAAARGARVTGVDPAARLLQVARERAAKQKLEADFVSGDAAAIPLADGEADVVVSVFGVIFSTRPCPGRRRDGEGDRAERAHPAECLDPGRPDLRDGPHRARGREPGAAHPARAAPVPLARARRARRPARAARLQRLARGAADLLHRRLARRYLDGEMADHPMALAGRAVLERQGQSEAVRARMLEVLEAGNEDPGAFRTTSRYVIVTAARS